MPYGLGLKIDDHFMTIKNDRLFLTIKKAILRIEDYAEKQLLSGEGSATGAIFWLKNHGWKDKTEVDHNLKDFSLFEDEVEKKAKKYETNKRSQKKVKK